jgi:hypothetical protein
MGALFEQQGDKTKARQRLAEALEIFTAKLGPEHPSTLGVKEWIAALD